ncbi:MAG: TlpA family protein disulfide reductase [Flavobacteriales bacterium]
MFKFTFIQTLMMVCGVLFAKAYEINGYALGFKGKIVYLERYEDYITFKKTIVAQAMVSEEGRFTINITPADAYEAFLRIDNNSGILYVDPETSKLMVSFPPYDKIHEKVMRENRISLLFVDPDKDDLNTLILEFNLRKDEFIYRTITKDTLTTFSKMEYSSPDFIKDLEAFKDSLYIYYKDIKKRFFIDYITYSIAELEQLSGMKDEDITRAFLYNAYLKGVSPRYTYAGYMRFFNLYFNDFFKVPYFGPEEDIIDAINFHQSYQRSMLVLSRTKLLENKRVRELVLMKNMLSVFHQKSYSQEGIITILDSISMISPYEENRFIAVQILKHLTKMLPGTPAPRLKGIDVNTGQAFQASSIQDKYVYVMFYATWCKPCMAEMDLIPDLKKKYGQYVEFVTVFIDLDEKETKDFLWNKRAYDWNFISIQGNPQVLDAYNVKSVPVYVLIDREGMIENAPARTPSPDGAYLTIDKDFFEIKKRLEPKREFKIGGKN